MKQVIFIYFISAYYFNLRNFYFVDDLIAVKKIAEKLRSPMEQEVRFYEIANAAIQKDRKELAIMLLDLESKPNYQVPLLLKVGETKKALMAATKSGNTDLVYTVLFELANTTALADFWVNLF